MLKRLVASVPACIILFVACVVLVLMQPSPISSDCCPPGMAGIITTVAGTGLEGYSGDGIPATAALLAQPRGVAVGPGGVVYIADTYNQRVRKVDRDGIITTIAGTGERGFSGDGGPATAGMLSDPTGLALGPGGGLYIADQDNHRIRKVDHAGIVTTVAGTGDPGYGGDGGPATAATLNSPHGVALGPDGSLYIADSYNQRVRKVAPGGIITTVAGNGDNTFSGDGGPATQAAVSTPYDLAVAPDGTFYIACSSANRVRKVDPDGIITTAAGTGEEGDSGDGGPATEARLHAVEACVLGVDGSLYLADSANNRVRRVDLDGIITTVAGNGAAGSYGDGGPAAWASVNRPWGLAMTPSGSLYIAERDGHRIRKVCGPAEPPTCTFTWTPAAPIAGEQVTFDGTASSDPDGAIVGWTWDFGDGESGAGSAAYHTYTVAAGYTVSLTVTDDVGCSTSCSQAIEVLTPPRTIHVGCTNVTGIEWGTKEYPYDTIQEGIDAAIDRDRSWFSPAPTTRISTSWARPSQSPAPIRQIPPSSR